jgi:hypothetical protein
LLTEGTFLNLMKPTYNKSIANIILNGENWNQEWERCLLSLLLFNRVLEFLAIAIRP